MKCKLIVIVVFGITIIGLISDVRAQNWTKITLPKSFALATPYFINENIGFVFDGDIGAPANLCRTIDGGKNWEAIHFFDPAKTVIHQLYFVSINQGYAATSEGVFETFDQGVTWKNIYVGHFNFASVYAVGSKVFAYGNKDLWYRFGPLISTINDGKTWDTIFTQAQVGYSVMRPYVCGNKEDLVFATYVSDTSYTHFDFAASKDSGKTWVIKSMDTIDVTNTRGLYSFPHCLDILRPYGHNGETISIFYSSDYGDKWDTRSPSYTEVSNWISGNNCIQYDSYPAEDVDKNGVWRSKNKGSNWEFISGPNFAEVDDPDFHNLSVVGGGAVVYAGSFAANATAILPQNYIWKTDNGGDGTLSSSALASHIAITHNLSSGSKDTLIGSICDSLSIGIFFENISCNYAKFQDIVIDGLDSVEYTTQVKHHLLCDGIPDTLLIQINTSYVGARNIVIHSSFINDEYSIIDTSFKFVLQTTAGVGGKASLYLKESNITASTKDTIEIPIYINSTDVPTMSGLTNVTLTYFLNTDLLSPFTFIPVSGITADPIKLTKTTATVTLHFDPIFTFSGETELGSLVCVPYITDTLRTDITLTVATHSSECLTTLTGSNVTHFTLIGCGSSLLSQFIKYGSAYDVISILPNPAGNFVKIELKNSSSLLHYELLDALGVARKNGSTTNNSIQINLSGLSPGNYYFRLIGESGIPITKKLVIMK